MPDQSNQNNSPLQTPDPSGSPPIDDNPPVVMPDFQSTDIPPVPADSTPTPPSDDMGTAAPPSDLPPMTTSTPKKKFGTGKIIATILGFLILAGGIVGGVVLTQQQQDIRERAGECEPRETGSCNPEGACNVGTRTCNASGGWGRCNCTTGDDGDDGGGGGDGGPAPCDTYSQSLCPSQCSPAGFKCTWKGSEGCKTSESRCTEQEGQIGGNGDYCNSSGCTAPSGKSCLILRYHCNRVTDLGGGCSDEQTDSSNSSLSFAANCGSEQIDIECTDGTKDFVSKIYSIACGGGSNETPNPSSPSTSAQCLNTKAYSSTWTLLTGAQLSALTTGTTINFCVAGSASAGVFDKAQFKINTDLKPETTTKRPSSNDYCQSYVIQAGDTTVNVKAKIHHTTLGWRGESI